jgi:hypothetical protein
MQLIISTESPDIPKHKCLALGIFSDEKPPRSICGFIDWRLNGLISTEIKQGRITGEFMEKVIIPFPRRIGTEILFLFGMGPLKELNYERIYAAAAQMVGAVDGMLLNNFAFDLPGQNRSGLSTPNIVEAMVTGVFDYLSEDVQKLSRMTSCIVTNPAHLKEVTAGVKQFKKNVKDLGSVDISALQKSFA